MSVYKAEYIWIDGAEPTPKLRSKTKIVKMGTPPPIWGFDGSTNQAAGTSRTASSSPCSCAPTRSAAASTAWSCARSSTPT
jgi:glutamine synthetase